MAVVSQRTIVAGPWSGEVPLDPMALERPHARARRRLDWRIREVGGAAALEACLRELGDDLIGPIDPLDLSPDCGVRLQTTLERAARLAAERALATMLEELAEGIGECATADEACDLLPLLDRAILHSALGID